MSKYLPLWPDRASTIAGQVDGLYIYLVLVSAVMTLLIFIAVAVLAIKYRRRPGVLPTPIEGSPVLETAWSVIQREINELHVQTGQNVKLIMTSQDVIHSFFIPAFRLKQDVLPGRYTTLWFNATEPGVYHLFCAEYCGTSHSGMGGSVIVLDPQDYAQWMAGGPSVPLPEAGKQLFTQLGCATCHRFDVQGRGPNLQGVFGKPVLLEDGRTVTADDNYVRESILNPTAKIVSGFKPVMPTFQGLVTDEQLNALVAYVKSLGGQAATGAQGQAAASPAAQPQMKQVQ